MTDSTLPAQGAMGRYHQVLRRRMLMIAVLVLAIVASLVLDFTLGSAAAFGAALAIILGIGIPGVPDQWLISVNAFVFALFAALMLDGVTRWTRVSTSCCSALRWCSPLTL